MTKDVDDLARSLLAPCPATLESSSSIIELLAGLVVERVRDNGRLPAACAAIDGGAAGLGGPLWSPELGVLQQAVRQGGRSGGEALAAALYAARRGLPFEVEVETSLSDFPVFAGVPLHHGEGVVAIESKPGSVTLSSRSETVAFHRSGENLLNRSEGRPLLAEVGPSIVCSTGYCADPFMVLPDDPVLAADAGYAAGRLREALALVREATPEYQPWIGQVLRHVHCVGTCASGMTVSRSSRHRPGYIVVSIEKDPLFVAEALVHECTHQYIFLLEALTPILAYPYDELIYSPLADRKRPLDRVLVAYHALLNMARFHRQARTALRSPGADARLNEVEAMAAESLAAITSRRARLTGAALAFLEGPANVAPVGDSKTGARLVDDELVPA